jgi:hypothetical protein
LLELISGHTSLSSGLSEHEEGKDEDRVSDGAGAGTGTGGSGGDGDDKGAFQNSEISTQQFQFPASWEVPVEVKGERRKDERKQGDPDITGPKSPPHAWQQRLNQWRQQQQERRREEEMEDQRWFNRVERELSSEQEERRQRLEAKFKKLLDRRYGAEDCDSGGGGGAEERDTQEAKRAQNDNKAVNVAEDAYEAETEQGWLLIDEGEAASPVGIDDGLQTTTRDEVDSRNSAQQVPPQRRDLIQRRTGGMRRTARAPILPCSPGYTLPRPLSPTPAPTSRPSPMHLLAQQVGNGSFAGGLPSTPMFLSPSSKSPLPITSSSPAALYSSYSATGGLSGVRPLMLSPARTPFTQPHRTFPLHGSAAGSGASGGAGGGAGVMGQLRRLQEQQRAQVARLRALHHKHLEADP